MIGACSQQHCHPDSGCILGEPDVAACKHWTQNTDTPGTNSHVHSRNSVPWSGSALGLDDIRMLSACARPRVVALIGPHNAGKTTYLAALHLLCLRKQIVPHLCFCGSWTLAGWEKIADFMRYPKESSPSYPPHTPISTERSPGLLHYAFRKNDELIQNVMFTDAPGEWFTEWSVNPSPTQYPGATWTIEHADTFLFFIDRESLVGPERGKARLQIKTLASRLSEHLAERPIAIVWAKSDISVATDFQSSIEEILMRTLPSATHFHTRFRLATQEAQEEVVAPLVKSFKFAIEQGRNKNTFIVDLSPQVSTDRFLAYRGVS
ncbi:hypothetical protein VN12_23540 [Pirellula sp. SH-Sr6A]|nr:hypothetical protein VN12_23540 [Pirellula sp. SH-Sr6A]